MRKNIVFAAILAATIGFAWTTSASAASCNFGSIMKNQTGAMHANQAPGQTKIGPVTRVNGEIHTPSAFEGGQCGAR